MEIAKGWAGKKVLTSPFVVQLLIIMYLVEFVKGALLVSILPVYMGEVLGLSVYAIGWALALQYIGDNAFRSPLGGSLTESVTVMSCCSAYCSLLRPSSLFH